MFWKKKGSSSISRKTFATTAWIAAVRGFQYSTASFGSATTLQFL